MKKRPDRSANPDEKKAKSWKRLLRSVCTFAFLVAVVVLLYFLLRDVDWQEVGAALRGYGPGTLALAVAIAAGSYLVFASYDLVGRHYTAHGLPVRYVLPLAFVCYAFNLNFGAWVGGLALRFRLYSRFGLSIGTVTTILAMSLLTNWMGYMLVAGGLFSLGLLDLPDHWWIDSDQLRWVGFLLLMVASGYLLLCAFPRRREFGWRGRSVTLPSLQLAVVQALLGAANWVLMAGLISLLLPKGVAYHTVLATLMVSSIAGAITHIPGGIGVLEAVFLGLLQGTVAKGELLAALIAYRGIYFLLPLGIAALTYLVLERKATALRSSRDGASALDRSIATPLAGEHQ